MRTVLNAISARRAGLIILIGLILIAGRGVGVTRAASRGGPVAGSDGRGFAFALQPDPDEMEQTLCPLYDAAIEPELFDAEGDDSLLDEAIGDFLRWANRVETGRPAARQADAPPRCYDIRMKQGFVAVQEGLNRAVDRAEQRCKGNHDLSQVMEMSHWSWVAMALGLATGPAGSLLDIDAVIERIKNCGSLRFELNSLVVASGGSTTLLFHVRAKIELPVKEVIARSLERCPTFYAIAELDDGTFGQVCVGGAEHPGESVLSLRYEADALTEYVSADAVPPPNCTVMSDPRGAPIRVLLTVDWPQSARAPTSPNIIAVIAPDRPTENWHVTCPRGAEGSLTRTGWWETWAILHAGERDGIRNWDIVRGEEAYATKTYKQTRIGFGLTIDENTELKLIQATGGQGP